MPTVNLNVNCSVTLSKQGAMHLNNLNKQVNTQIMGGSGCKIKQDYKQGDFYQSQLWNLMEVFGPMMQLGTDGLPFLSNEIYFEE